MLLARESVFSGDSSDDSFWSIAITMSGGTPSFAHASAIVFPCPSSPVPFSTASSFPASAGSPAPVDRGPETDAGAGWKVSRENGGAEGRGAAPADTGGAAD